MAKNETHIITRYDETGRYLGWSGEKYASKKSAQEAADDLNANLESGDYLWAPDTEEAVTAYREAYGEDGPPADTPDEGDAADEGDGEDAGDAEESEDVGDVEDEPAADEAAEDDGAADE